MSRRRRLPPAKPDPSEEAHGVGLPLQMYRIRNYLLNIDVDHLTPEQRDLLLEIMNVFKDKDGAIHTYFGLDGPSSPKRYPVMGSAPGRCPICGR
jgi:hypothetical protein